MENEELVEEETTEEEPLEETEEVVEDEESEEEESTDDEVDWKAEALKYKAIAERTKKKSKPVTNNIKSNLSDKAENPDVDDRIAQLELAEKKRQFGYEHGLSPAQTDKIFQLNSDPDESVLKDPFVKEGLKALKRQERVGDNTPSISAKAQTFQKKDFSKLNETQKQAEFEKFMKSKGVFE